MSPEQGFKDLKDQTQIQSGNKLIKTLGHRNFPKSFKSSDKCQLWSYFVKDFMWRLWNLPKQMLKLEVWSFQWYMASSKLSRFGHSNLVSKMVKSHFGLNSENSDELMKMNQGAVLLIKIQCQIPMRSLTLYQIDQSTTWRSMNQQQLPFQACDPFLHGFVHKSSFNFADHAAQWVSSE